MKTLIIYIGLIIYCKLSIAQKPLIGCYGRMDSQIKLNADSTFTFFHAVDTYRGWLKGTWTLRRKKIKLTPNLAYDTITLKKGELTIDSLILSKDYTAERIAQTNQRWASGFRYEQNEGLCPKMLKYKVNILYVVKNKRIQKKKINNGYYKSPFNPWYTRSQCKY